MDATPSPPDDPDPIFRHENEMPMPMTTSPSPPLSLACDGGPRHHQHRLSTSSLASTSPTASTVTNSNGSDASSDNDAAEYFAAAEVKRANERAAGENERLNLNLGLPVDLAVLARRECDAEGGDGSLRKLLRPPVRAVVRLLDRLLSFIESPLFRFWGDRVPLRLRQRLTFLAWGIYLPIHKALIGRRTGLHRDVSLEYHAMTSVMWWGRLFPVTIKRMRFSLSQLHVWHPPDRFPRWRLTNDSFRRDSCNTLHKPNNGTRYGIRGHLSEVYHRMDMKRTQTGFRSSATEPSAAEMTVTGHYIQHSTRPSRKVIFWVFGGAFLAGDSMGNLGIAEKMGMLCAGDGESGGVDCDSEMRDVFVPDYRLVPEYHLDDAFHDIVLAFEYLIYERGVQPECITLVGVSSGGGLVVLLLQALANAQREMQETNVRDNEDCVPMPAGGVMMGPFVDYTEPKGSMKEYIKHDLIVNQSVYDEGIPHMEQVLGSHENRVRSSPVYGNFKGLPPLCICVSEHEVVYDQTMILAKRAKDQGVDVTVGVWKYMCHVFPMLCAFIPEGQESFDFMCKWIRER